MNYLMKYLTKLKNFKIQNRRLLLITLGAGILTLLLRVWLYATGIDGRGLLLIGHPGNWLGYVITALYMLFLGFCTYTVGKNAPSYHQMFPANPLSFFGNIVAGVGIGIVSIIEMVQNFQFITLVLCLVGLASAASLVYLALCRQKRVQPSMAFHGVFTLYLMIHTVSQYRTWSSQTQLQDHFFSLLASIFVLLAVFQHAAIDAREGNRKAYIFFNQAALFFSLAAIRDSNWLFFLSAAIWAGCNLCTFQSAKRSATLHTGPMYLPKDVRLCIQMLQKAGFSAYAVGGCVRDSLLGIRPHDYDLCTDALPRQICRVFHGYDLVRNGEKHGTIGVVMNKKVYEITTFRTEGTYSDNRHPDEVEFVTNLEEDLRRRDFTVNAIAYAPGKGYIDPWGGRRDLEKHILRAVGEPQVRFQEDALRILRGVRFAVRFDLNPTEDTLAAMEQLAPTMDFLARERVFDELCKLLPLVSAKDLIRFAPILTQVIPELAPTVGFDQRSPHHAYDVFTHTAYVVQGVPETLPLRWAALLHDIGKVSTFTLDENGRGHFYGHAKISGEIANRILHRLRASTTLREQVVFLVENHMQPFEPDKRILRRRLSEFGPENVFMLLALQKADFGNKGVPEEEDPFAETEAILDEILKEKDCLTAKDLAINGRDILALGFEPGPEIGRCMTFLLHQVQDDSLPNEAEALLQAAKIFLQQ